MRKSKVILSVIFITILHISQFSGSLTSIYINGKIFNGLTDELNEALVIRNGRILFVGTTAKALRFNSKKQRKIIDLNGKSIIPGFHDADLNFPLGAGLLGNSIDFHDLDQDSILHRLKAKKKNLVAKDPIYGYNFEHLLWKDRRWPNKYDLDKVSNNLPIIIFSSDGNTAWVNSTVLKECGIEKNSPEIQGGRIVRFEDNEPTGILCGNSIELLKRFNFENAVQNIKLDKKKILKAIKYANSLGLTSVTTLGDLKFVKFLEELESVGKLNLRFNIILPSKNIGRYLIKKVAFNSGTSFVRVISISKNIDGNLYTSDAAMFSPYPDRSYYGFIRSNKNDLSDLVSLYKQNGIIGSFYAEGDRAVHIVLKAIKAASRRNQVNLSRSRISNFTFVIDDDISLLKLMSVIPVMRPGSFITEVESIERIVGQRKAGNALRAGTLKSMGVQVAFGSGWPGDSLNPLKGIKFSVFRNVSKGNRNGWFVEEKLSMREAIKAYTYTPSFSVSNENRTGTIEKGKLADIIILNGDIFSENLSPETFSSETKVVETIIGGKTVFRKEETKVKRREPS